MSDEIQNLYDLIQEGQEDLENDELFRRAVSEGLEVLQIEDIDFANELSVARSTVNRWKDGKCGKSLPHPIMRKPVYKVLLDFLKIKEQ